MLNCNTSAEAAFRSYRLSAHVLGTAGRYELTRIRLRVYIYRCLRKHPSTALSLRAIYTRSDELLKRRTPEAEVHRLSITHDLRNLMEHPRLEYHNRASGLWCYELVRVIVDDQVSTAILLWLR
jgi:hypothetical protein